MSPRESKARAMARSGLRSHVKASESGSDSRMVSPSMRQVPWSPPKWSWTARDRSDAFEIFCWCCTMLFWGFLYNSVGELASLRGLDYSGVIITRWDVMIPVVPVMVVPYILVYFHPPVYVLGTISKHGLRKAVQPVRRFYTTQVFLMALSYVIYIALPTSIADISMRVQGLAPPADASFITLLNYRFIHEHLTLFNACPSMHVGHTLSMAIIHWDDASPGYRWGMLGAAVTFFSTVLTRAHYVMDIPCGIIMALVFDRAIFRPWKARKTLSAFDKWMNQLPHLRRAMLCASVPVLILLLNEYLSRVTGTRVDAIGMLLGRPRI